MAQANQDCDCSVPNILRFKCWTAITGYISINYVTVTKTPTKSQCINIVVQGEECSIICYAARIRIHDAPSGANAKRISWLMLTNHYSKKIAFGSFCHNTNPFTTDGKIKQHIKKNSIRSPVGPHRHNKTAYNLNKNWCICLNPLMYMVHQYTHGKENKAVKNIKP